MTQPRGGIVFRSSPENAVKMEILSPENAVKMEILSPENAGQQNHHRTMQKNNKIQGQHLLFSDVKFHLFLDYDRRERSYRIKQNVRFTAYIFIENIHCKNR